MCEGCLSVEKCADLLQEIFRGGGFDFAFPDDKNLPAHFDQILVVAFVPFHRVADLFAPERFSGFVITFYIERKKVFYVTFITGSNNCAEKN